MKAYNQARELGIQVRIVRKKENAWKVVRSDVEFLGISLQRADQNYRSESIPNASPTSIILHTLTPLHASCFTDVAAKILSARANAPDHLKEVAASEDKQHNKDGGDKQGS